MGAGRLPRPARRSREARRGPGARRQAPRPDHAEVAAARGHLPGVPRRPPLRARPRGGRGPGRLPARPRSLRPVARRAQGLAGEGDGSLGLHRQLRPGARGAARSGAGGLAGGGPGEHEVWLRRAKLASRRVATTRRSRRRRRSGRGPGPARRRPAPAARPALPLGRGLRPPRHAPAPPRPLARHAVHRLRPLLQRAARHVRSAPSRSAPRSSAGSASCPPCAPPCAMAGSPTRRPASSRPSRPASGPSTTSIERASRLPCIALAREAEAAEEQQTCAAGELSCRLPAPGRLAPRGGAPVGPGRFRKVPHGRRGARGRRQPLHRRLEAAPRGAEHPPEARPRPRWQQVPGPGLQPRRRSTSTTSASAPTVAPTSRPTSSASAPPTTSTASTPATCASPARRRTASAGGSAPPAARRAARRPPGRRHSARPARRPPPRPGSPSWRPQRPEARTAVGRGW